MSDTLTEVCTLAELADGAILKRRVGGRTIAVARQGEQLLAFLPSCPHRGGPLECGRIVPLLAGDVPGEPQIVPGRSVLSCPWHGWEFGLDDGASVLDPTVTLRTFPCELRDGRVLVDLSKRTRSA